MTAHELARALLNGPDLPVIIQDDHYGTLVEVLTVETPIHARWMNWRNVKTAERAGEAIELGSDS